MKTLRLTIVSGTVLLAMTLAHAQAPPSDASLTTNPVYEKNCEKCHGKNATGRTFAGPSLVNDKTAAASADDLRNIVTNGKGHMPKFTGKLTAEEIDTLITQIQALNKK